jgi:site-specific recombinase XerD
MKPTDLARLLTTYLSTYLPGHLNVSTNTIKSYRDTFKLLLEFCNSKKAISPKNLTINHIDENLVYEFLLWIENERKCKISTRNQRLAAIHAFFRYIQIEAPEMLLPCQKILSIPFKRSGIASVSYLSIDALKLILAQPDRTVQDGRRDLVLMTTLYDTGARVQELVDMVVRDIRLESPPVIVLTGKGNKTRHVPVMSRTANILSDYLKEHNLNNTIRHDHPVFYNHQHKKLTRAGVAYIINKYVEVARKLAIVQIPNAVTPHVFRHTKAMHLLQANVNLVYIRDLLGHTNVSTTEIYARADSEMKRLALERAYVEVVTGEIPAWSENDDLLDWLQKFCNQ